MAEEFDALGDRLAQRIIEALRNEPPRVQHEWLSPEQAATYLSCDRHWLARLRLKGGGPRWHKHGDRFVRYRRTELDAWMRAGRNGGGEA